MSSVPPANPKRRRRAADDLAAWTCSFCHGAGRVDGKRCEACDGRGHHGKAE